jgi:hypothetical protein
MFYQREASAVREALDALDKTDRSRSGFDMVSPSPGQIQLQKQWGNSKCATRQSGHIAAALGYPELRCEFGTKEVTPPNRG